MTTDEDIKRHVLSVGSLNQRVVAGTLPPEVVRLLVDLVRDGAHLVTLSRHGHGTGDNLVVRLEYRERGQEGEASEQQER